MFPAEGPALLAGRDRPDFIGGGPWFKIGNLPLGARWLLIPVSES